MNCIRWLTSVLLLPAWLHAHACELRVRSHPDPLVYARLPDGGLSGPQLETVREALRRAGCRMKLVPLPWARALRELEDGHLDVLPGAHRLPEREVFAYFSKSEWMAENHLFVRRPPSGELGELAPTSLAAFLQRQRLGVQTGVRYGKELDSLIQERPDLALKVERVVSRRSLWLMLAMGRVDGVLADGPGGLRELAELGLNERLMASGLRVDAEPSLTAFSRRTVKPDLVLRYDAAMKAMQADGTRAAIDRRFKELLAGRKPRG